VCNADLLEKKAFLEARCGLAEARLADLVEEHRLGVAERDCSIAALERREAGGRLVVDAMLLDDIQARPTLPLPPSHPISFPPTPTHQPLTCSIHVGATYSCWIGLIRADALGPNRSMGPFVIVWFLHWLLYIQQARLSKPVRFISNCPSMLLLPCLLIDPSFP
jgi:hypothetical protein